MIAESLIFVPSGGIDTDSNARAVAKGDYRTAEYCRLGQVSGEGFTVINSLGTREVENEDLSSADRIVGAGVWQDQNSIVYLVYKAIGDDQVWVYDVLAETHTLAAESADFNFDPSYPFFHFDIIQDLAKFTGGKWDADMYDPTDGSILYNPPMQLNIQKALDGEYPVIDLQVIDAIKYPPKPPVSVYGTDTTHVDNKLRRKLFRFRIQYIYENSEETVWSLWSNLALPTQSEFVSGNNWPDSQADNKIDLTFNTGPNVVKKINIAVQIRDDNAGGAETSFGVFEQLDKASDGISDNVDYVYTFYGNVSLKPIDPIVSLKNFDRLPIWAGCSTFIENTRIAYTQFIEGYDKIELDVTSEYVPNEIVWKPKFDYYFSSTYNSPITTWKFYTQYDATAEFPFQVGDSISVPFQFNSDDNVQFFTFNVTQSFIDSCITPSAGIISVQNRYAMLYIGNEIGANFDAIPLATIADVPLVGDQVRYETTYDSSLYSTTLSSLTTTQQRQTLSTPSLKVGATHPLGIVYGDRAFRDGTVLTNDALNLFVPWYSDIDTSAFTDPNNPFTVSPKMTINHVPPIWAEYYWIVWRKATEISDFSQWVINATVPSGDVAGTAVVANGLNRFDIYLDRFYLDRYQGASINHTPQKGDIVRFVRQRLPVTDPIDPSAYIPVYFELEVMAYDPIGAPGPRPMITVEVFDRTLIDPNTWTGQTIEIYTPRPTLDIDGTLFVAEWRDGSEAFEIGDAHTENRYHKGTTELTGDVLENGDIGESAAKTTTDVGEFDPDGRVVVFTNDDGDTETFTALTTSETEPGVWKITIDGLFSFDFSSANGGVFAFQQNQVVVGGVSTSPAILDLDFGDVYVRQRNYGSGYTSASDVGDNAYYFIEDPHYSDYWLSDIHQFGRFEVESPYAKQIERVASIHSDVYFPETQVNGLSSFGLDNSNIMEMNPVYGRVVRTFLSGREEKTLKCIQEKKENSIYIQHYPDQAEVPTGNLRVSDKTFASWYPYKGIYGCSDVGGSVLYVDGTTYYFDRLNGVFVHSSENGQIVISEKDPSTGNDFKFRKKTKEITARLNAAPNSFVRSYVDITQQEIGFGFAFETAPAVEVNGSMPSGTSNLTVSGNYSAYVGAPILISQNGEYYSGTILTYTQVGSGSRLGLDIASPFLSSSVKANIYAVYDYELVTFDVLNNRWRSYYYYPFQWFANFGQSLVGWGSDTQLYVHNDPDSLTFHGETYTSLISPVSNQDPMAVKRYQNLVQRANQTFSVRAYAEPNQSYSEMETEMPNYWFTVYEGYSKGPYRMNRYSPGYSTEDLAMLNGEEMRAHSLVHEMTYDPQENGEGFVLFSLEIDYINS